MTPDIIRDNLTHSALNPAFSKIVQITFLKGLMFVALSLLIASCSTKPSPDNCPKCVDPRPEVAQMLNLVNQARATSRVCGSTTMPATTPLSLNDRLITAAQKHSEDMRLAGKMSHTTPAGAKHYAPGTLFDQRILQEGYIYHSVAENVAEGYNSAAEVMEAWLSSPGHCQNIMSVAFSEVGFGYDGDYWTQDFASLLNP
jgi:uncharacterized protein YkwD